MIHPSALAGESALIAGGGSYRTMCMMISWTTRMILCVALAVAAAAHSHAETGYEDDGVSAIDYIELSPCK